MVCHLRSKAGKRTRHVGFHGQSFSDSTEQQALSGFFHWAIVSPCRRPGPSWRAAQGADARAHRLRSCAGSKETRCRRITRRSLCAVTSRSGTRRRHCGHRLLEQARSGDSGEACLQRTLRRSVATASKGGTFLALQTPR
jgi:hypothetical protein